MYDIYNTYDNQIGHRNPSFNLLILYNNSFVNQGSEINKKNKIILNFTYCLLLITFFLLHI